MALILGELSPPVALAGVVLGWTLGVRALRSGIVVHGDNVHVRGILWSHALCRRDIAFVDVADAVTLRFADCLRIGLVSGRTIKCISLDPKWVDDSPVLFAVQRALIPRAEEGPQ
jgi:hypothetical protein